MRPIHTTIDMDAEMQLHCSPVDNITFAVHTLHTHTRRWSIYCMPKSDWYFDSNLSPSLSLSQWQNLSIMYVDWVNSKSLRRFRHFDLSSIVLSMAFVGWWWWSWVCAVFFCCCCCFHVCLSNRAAHTTPPAQERTMSLAVILVKTAAGAIIASNRVCSTIRFDIFGKKRFVFVCERELQSCHIELERIMFVINCILWHSNWKQQAIVCGVVRGG